MLPDLPEDTGQFKATLESWGAMYEQCEAKRGICAACLGSH